MRKPEIRYTTAQQRSCYSGGLTERKKKDNKKIDTQELLETLEPLMRRIIREELQQIINTPVDYLNPDSPLYNDMLDIQERKESGKLEFMTHQEVWGE